MNVEEKLVGAFSVHAFRVWIVNEEGEDLQEFFVFDESQDFLFQLGIFGFGVGRIEFFGLVVESETQEEFGGEESVGARQDEVFVGGAQLESHVGRAEPFVELDIFEKAVG